ncbi:MAG: hypothetical protein JWO98_4717 [Frankiales bacterium]|nr:hypothetical protein [Frankiales bacterium]
MSEATTDHQVMLPYPDHGEPTVGACRCGWTVIYGWGQHGDGQDAAERHISDTTRTEPVVTSQLSGKRYVMPGLSL